MRSDYLLANWAFPPVYHGGLCQILDSSPLSDFLVATIIVRRALADAAGYLHHPLPRKSSRTVLSRIDISSPSDQLSRYLQSNLTISSKSLIAHSPCNSHKPIIRL